MSAGRSLTRLLNAERPARAVAICRIGIGLAALIIGLKTAHDLFLLQRPEYVRAPFVDWLPSLESTSSILAFTGIWIAICLGLIVGYRARVCALALVVGSVLRFLIDQNLWGNHGYFVGLLLLLLSMTESDRSLSVRWVREGRPERQVTAWPLMLLQLQLSIVYFYSAVAKMNPYFLGGDFLRTRLSVPGVVDSPFAMTLIEVSTIGVELFLSFALWIPTLQPWGFLAGAVFHGLIPLSIHLHAALVAFSIATLSPYILFLDDRPASRVVIWDDHCGFCRSWVQLFRRLDWLRIHRFEGASPDVLAQAGITREQADEEVKVWDGARVYGGIDAVREILKYMPLGFLWAQALALPGVRWIGRQAYRAVARRRMCLTVGTQSRATR